ncbi:MAG: hypothetical protein PHS37_09960 [Candidatus Omnitrophica bacterium]|nr:hypothetical protein [Candidatus Omnitrophota bacterium]
MTKIHYGILCGGFLAVLSIMFCAVNEYGQSVKTQVTMPQEVQVPAKVAPPVISSPAPVQQVPLARAPERQPVKVITEVKEQNEGPIAAPPAEETQETVSETAPGTADKKVDQSFPQDVPVKATVPGPSEDTKSFYPGVPAGGPMPQMPGPSNAPVSVLPGVTPAGSQPNVQHSQIDDIIKQFKPQTSLTEGPPVPPGIRVKQLPISEPVTNATGPVKKD